MKNRKKIVAARFTPSDALLLYKVCESRGEDVGDFIRRSVRSELAKLSFFSDLDKKSLGIKIDQTKK